MQSTETELLSLRPSRVLVLRYYLGAFLLFVFSFIIGIGIFSLPGIGPFPAGAVTIAVIGFFSFIALILLLIAELRRLSTKYVITNFRVIRKVGILRRSENAMPYNKLERVELTQGILDRILGIGSVVIDTGEDQVTIDSVRNPRNVEQTVMGQLQKVR